MNSLSQSASPGCSSCNAWRNRCHSRRVLGVLSDMPSQLPITIGVHIPMATKCASPAGECWGSSWLGPINSLPQLASSGCPSCNAWRNRCHSWRVLGDMPSKLPITVGVHIPMSYKFAAPAGESLESSSLGLVKSLPHRASPWWNVT